MPIRFNYPLTNRSLRTVTGVGFVLIPLSIAWSAVNLPNSFLSYVNLTPGGRIVTVTPASFLTQTIVDPIGTDVPSTPGTVVIPKTEEERASGGWFTYFTLCYPFFILVFGFVVWLPINLLMPIVHVELLLGEAAPDIMEQLREYFED